VEQNQIYLVPKIKIVWSRQVKIYIKSSKSLKILDHVIGRSDNTMPKRKGTKDKQWSSKNYT